MNNFFLFSFGLRIVGEEYKKKKKKTEQRHYHEEDRYQHILE